MLRLAVRRNCARVIHRDFQEKVRGSSHSSEDLPDLPYVICDPNAKGVIRYASQAFQGLVGWADCEGQQLFSPATLLQSEELKQISHEAGLSGDEVAKSLHRMAQAAEEAVQSTATGAMQMPLLLLSHCTSGELFVCQTCWRKNVHPTLGWSYCAGVVQNVSRAMSVGRLVVAACKETTYAELCTEWAETASDVGLHSRRLASDEELHAAAEKMWKDELAKGVKPTSAPKNREADMSSIWSRSTASTISSADPNHANVDDRPLASYHFGALFGMLPSEEREKCSNSEKQMEKSPNPPEVIEPAQLPTAESFESASEDEFEECETMSPSSSISDECGPPLFDDVEDPVKHIDRAKLRSMKQAFVLAVCNRPPSIGSKCSSSGVLDFPIALRSAGLEESAASWPAGPAWKARVGSNARDVFQPGPASGTRARLLWKTFCECFESQEFFTTEAGGGVALLGDLQEPLPDGEFAFVQPFHSRLGNPIDCLVYVKHIELDGCPYLLALHSYLPND
ncbi:unnamed protein product [Effrenium voratum]|nr:unnamed protein product [Effrenium voratum]